MDLSIITINYNAGPHLNECVCSLLKQAFESCEIIVIDNASSDHSLEAIQPRHECGQLNLVRNDKNTGFSKANNQAFTLSQGRYIYFINPDAKFITSDGLVQLIQYMDTHPEVGILGTGIIEAGSLVKPKLQYPGEQYLKNRLPPLVGDIAWVIGASMIVRRELFEQLHGFDENFFLYGEETDLCLRARQLGYHIAHLETIQVEHIGSVSESNTLPFDYYKKKQQALYLFYQKHYHSEDVKRLQHRDQFKAWWRLKTLTLKKKLKINSTNDFDKLQRYRAISDVCKS